MVARLKEKVAIVTGATSGIGEATARRFAAEGAQVVIVGRNVERGHAVESQIRSSGGDATFVRTDLAVDDDVQAMVQHAVASYGGIDILVNAAYANDLMSEGAGGPITTQTSGNFERQVQVEIYGPYRTTKYVIPEMQRRGGGSIINVSAMVAFRGVPGMATYGMGKGALHGLTWSVAVDYGPDWIRANVVVVGIVPTSDATRQVFADPAAGRAVRSMNALPRTGSPDDVASACAFLASDDASWITGTSITVDGGLTIKFDPPALGALLPEDQAQASGDSG
jgi:NAD(P)-dependent dehydrogenase (short-subunit alcohol dehydrogenase family)